METKSKHTCLTYEEAEALFPPVDYGSGHAFGHRLEAKMDSIRDLVKSREETCEECRKKKRPK